jgi:hypothetical protein
VSDSRDGTWSSNGERGLESLVTFRIPAILEVELDLVVEDLTCFVVDLLSYTEKIRACICNGFHGSLALQLAQDVCLV